MVESICDICMSTCAFPGNHFRRTKHETISGLKYSRESLRQTLKINRRFNKSEWICGCQIVKVYFVGGA